MMRPIDMHEVTPTTSRFPFLSAHWSNLALLTYAVLPAVLRQFVPPMCELDTIDGSAFVSLVAFDFLDTRVGGIRWPGFVNFSEINLRFYVHHQGVRGVAFIREFVPPRVVAVLARIIYNEPYSAAPMASRVQANNDGIIVDHTLTLGGETHSLRINADATTVRPAEGSIEHFFKEHDWGFGTSRGGRLIRYRVEHPPWDIHPVRSFELHLNWEKVYGPQWAFLQNAQPYSVILAVGSAVRVFPKGVKRTGLNNHPIVLFDGVCDLCEKSVNFIIAHDPYSIFRFVPLQSKIGRRLLLQHQLDADALQTVVLIESGRAYTRSTAALRIIRRLRWPLSVLSMLIAIPSPLRDAVYELVARNRYRWFGRHQTCQLPTPATAQRFISTEMFSAERKNQNC